MSLNKTIYFYWGNETMSYMRYMTLYSFCLFNPDWKVCLIKNNIISNRHPMWLTPERLDKVSYAGPDYSNLVNNLNIEIIEFQSSMIDLEEHVVNNMSDVHIKDILNWKILSKQGGVVADMDILFTKPIGNNIEEDAEIGLVCFDDNPKKDYIPVTFMYSSGSNAFFDKVYWRALKKYNPSIYECCGTLCIEEKNLQQIKDNYPKIKIQKLNDAIVFPLIKFEWDLGVQMLYNGVHTKDIDSASIGIHWYGGTLLSQFNNNLIDDKTVYRLYDTITTTIQNILEV